MESTKNVKGSEFHVVMSGMKLPERLENRIASEIQRVVSAALNDYPNPDDPDGVDGPAGGPIGPRKHGTGRFGPYIHIPSKEWLGKWIYALGKDFKINPDVIAPQEKLLQNGVQQRMG
jgi:hypothetical protein